ncbi:glycoside hydrolase family 6 protein [Micromonospora siamensis]|uniref:Glucanase n=1 Tax=Micromonospora siamensis TaxID=299152 RepID=A0A1C5IN20_9ACTN|nr:glycoside hydrolase family 6 protein [Micromonospora siamensis]SCG59216.1 endoglucanase [Micromonospora siamensis]
MRSALLTGTLVTVLVGALGCAATPPEAQPPVQRHPFRDAVMAVDPALPALRWQRAHRAGWLDPITQRPQARWVNGPRDLPELDRLLRSADQAGALAVLVVRYLPNRDCEGWGAADGATYDAFLGDLVSRIGDRQTAVILEPGGLDAECFDDERAALLTAAVTRLADAGQYVYLDAGIPYRLDERETAQRLRRAGIDRAEGFAVNVGGRELTQFSHLWGLAVSDLVDGREMVIDTSRNTGPPPAEAQSCNPPKRGLGYPPTTRPELERVAALLWVKHPGESDGDCERGEPAEGQFFPTLAWDAIVRAPWLAPFERLRAASARRPEPPPAPGPDGAALRY